MAIYCRCLSFLQKKQFVFTFCLNLKFTLFYFNVLGPKFLIHRKCTVKIRKWNHLYFTNGKRYLRNFNGFKFRVHAWSYLYTVKIGKDCSSNKYTLFKNQNRKKCIISVTKYFNGFELLGRKGILCQLFTKIWELFVFLCAKEKLYRWYSHDDDSAVTLIMCHAFVVKPHNCDSGVKCVSLVWYLILFDL